ncbi:MAG: response regulator [Pseudomonadota bacterium]
MADPQTHTTVLYGSPDALFCECLTALFKALPYNAHRPIRSDALLRELDHVTPDIVLLDDSYGEEQVAQLSHALKRRAPEVPVAVMTANWLASEGARLNAAGVDHILRKPFGVDRLIELIDSLPVHQREDTCSADA